MKKRVFSCLAVGGFLFFAGTAHAQATRTWVSGVGDDANPCSRTAPCKTFAGAISKTASAGIINCIDPGGFGAVTITKSITIDCRNTIAGILVAGRELETPSTDELTGWIRNEVQLPVAGDLPRPDWPGQIGRRHEAEECLGPNAVRRYADEQEHSSTGGHECFDPHGCLVGG